MPPHIFVDTAAWIALLNRDDDLHAQATTVMQSLQRSHSQLITTEFILLEVADALNRPQLRSKTITFIDRLPSMKMVQIIPLSHRLWQAGWVLYCQRVDKSWGLTDCTSFIVMQEQHLSVAFTSDKHFEQAGFTRLMKPET